VVVCQYRSGWPSLLVCAQTADCTTLEPTLLNFQFRFVCDTNVTSTLSHDGLMV
jgi:hypothetical protein